MSEREIAPIETVYSGYRFRSRIEARWAVAFDDLGIKWEYEPEGFDLTEMVKRDPHFSYVNEDGSFDFPHLQNLGWYLPDFLLHEMGKSGTYVEIKGQMPTPEERHRARALQATSKRNVIILFGQIPHPKDFPLDGNGYCLDPLMGVGAGWLECPKCHSVYLGYIHLPHCGKCRIEWDKRAPTPRLTAAFTAARSARFEAGK